MLKIGITGQSGFIGTHLYNTIGLYPDKYIRMPFEKRFFDHPAELEHFVSRCDVVVHLAGVNRHEEQDVLHDANVELTQKLIAALRANGVKPYVIFSSSLQENSSNRYGESKRKCRELLEQWAKAEGVSFSGLIIPNVYGPFAKPGYNSFVATFCHRLVRDETPEVLDDKNIPMLYVGSLIRYILQKTDGYAAAAGPVRQAEYIKPDFEENVSAVLHKLLGFKSLYLDNGLIPGLSSIDEVNLFNTFRSYIDHKQRFPVDLTPHRDERGMFMETVRTLSAGQSSFSVTYPGISRGDHFHLHKIERFTILSGSAEIKMRRVGTDEVLKFRMDGSRPSYVDIPVWYTHSIRNIGGDDLYMQFWTNEMYDQDDPDTWSEKV